MTKKDKNNLLNIHYSRTLTSDNLSKAANYVGEYVLKGLGALGKFLNAGFTSPTYGTTGQVSYARNAEDAKRLREQSEASEQAMGKAMTWVSPLNYGAALATGNGLDARKGEEEVASWSPAWQAVGRLGELYAGPKGVKAVKAVPKTVVNAAAKTGVKPIKAAVIARETKLASKNNIVGASYDYRMEDPKGSMDFLKQFFALLKINGKEYTLEGLKDAKNVQQGLPEYIQSYLNLNTVERAVRAMRKNGYSEREIQLYINKVNEEMNKVKVGMYSDLEYNAAGALDFGGFYNNDLNFISVNRDAYLKDPKFTPDYVMKHEGRHLIDYRTGMVDELNKILEEAYDKDFLDIPNHEDAGSLKGYEHMNRERVTTNRDARDVLLSSKGKNLLNEHKFMLYASKNGLSNNMVDFLNKIIKYAQPEDIISAVENSNGYGRRYINYLKKNNKLTPAKIEQLRLAMIHVPSYLLPIAGGYTLYNLFNLPLQQLQYQKQGGKMNTLEFLKNGGQIRKMQTAAGGPLKKPRIKLNGLWRELNYEGNGDFSTLTKNGKMSFTTGQKSPKSIVGNKEIVVTPEQTTVLDKLDNTKNYYSAYNPDDVIKGFNILTLGGLNNLSPTQWARRIYDTGKLATGNMTWSGYTDSWINGNNGLVSQKFSEEHPYLSAGANIIGDTLPIALATTPLNAINKVELIGKITVPGFIGGVGGIYVGDKLDEYLPKKYKNLGKSIGYGVGAALGVKLGLSRGINNPLLLRTKYTKLNDVVNNPLTTTAATIQGKYPWTRRQDIRLKRLLFDDIEEAKIWLNNSGYDRMYLPEVRILKKDLYYPDAIGKYNTYYNEVTVLPTFNKYSNLPLETNSNKLMTFKGVVNHELTHGRLNYFGSYSEYDPESGYWIARKDLDMESLNPFKLKKNGSWSASPDEFDSELSNLLITTGKSAFEPVDNISPLMRRLSISKQAARNFEKDILNSRKSLEFFKDGGKMNTLEFLKNGSSIHIKKKNRGKFTDYCGGKVTNECIRKAKASGNPTLVKRATFALNARHFKHRLGGSIVEAFKLRRLILNSLNNMIND